MIKLITLDLDNTLWDIDPVIINAEKKMRAWIAEHMPEAVAAIEMDQIKGTYKHALIQHPELIHHPSNLRKKILFLSFLKINLAEQEAHNLSEKAFNIFYRERNRITLFHQAEATLKKINQHHSIIALSNGNANLDMIGIQSYFTAHFSAETEGKPKPYKNMFLKALEFANVTPQETIHIGDHAKEDVQAAQKLGFHTIWFNQNNQQDMTLCHPTAVITDIQALPLAIETISQQQEKTQMATDEI